jgi:16S rRNA processing protein RimM
MTRRVVIGRLSGVFGVRGEFKFRPTPLGAEAFEAGRTYDIVRGDDVRTLRCRSVRRHHEKLLVAFDGIDTPEQARPIAGCDVRADVAELELGPDEYLDADLVGLRLIDANGGDLGRVVVGVAHYPAQDCLIVDPGRALVPMVKAFLTRIDLETRTISTTLPEGLLD